MEQEQETMPKEGLRQKKNHQQKRLKQSRQEEKAQASGAVSSPVGGEKEEMALYIYTHTIESQAS